MKKFTALVLKVSLVLSGLMILTNHVGATKRDVETALSLMRQARIAIGGDSALGGIQSLDMKGKTTRTLQIDGEADRQLNGEFELALMQPNGLFRIDKIGANHDGAETAVPGGDTEKGNRVIRIETGPKIVINDDGKGGPEAGNVMFRHNDEYTRYMISLLLTAPESANVTFDYVGDGDVDGARADIVAVSSADGGIMKLYLDKQSHLPLMMTHMGYDMPSVMTLHAKVRSDNADTAAAGEGAGQARIIIRKVPGDGTAAGQVTNNDDDVVIERGGELPAGKHDGPVVVFKTEGGAGSGETGTFKIAMPEPKEAEIQTRFADFRSVNGVMLPFRLTQTVNGKQTEVMTVDTYGINSPDTAEKFGPGKVRFVTRSKE